MKITLNKHENKRKNVNNLIFSCFNRVSHTLHIKKTEITEKKSNIFHFCVCVNHRLTIKDYVILNINIKLI